MAAPPSLSLLLTLEAQLLSRPLAPFDADLFPQAHQSRLNALVSQSRIPALETQRDALSLRLRDLEMELMMQKWKITQVEKEIAAEKDS